MCAINSRRPSVRTFSVSTDIPPTQLQLGTYLLSDYLALFLTPCPAELGSLKDVVYLEVNNDRPKY